MDNKSEMFDLKREKQELDAFLSTIEAAETSAPLPLKETATGGKEAIPTWEVPLPELSGLKMETPVSQMPKEESDLASVNEFLPRASSHSAPPDITDQERAGSEKTSSFMDLDDERKPQPAQRITISHGVKPLESFKTMTRFDGSMKPAEDELAQVSLSDNQKVAPTVEPDRKTDKVSAGPYDFTPEKKGGGSGKWLWILLIVILLLAGAYFAFSSKFFSTGLGSFLKTDRGVYSSSVDEIRLMNIRQRLVYNVKMGKSIRVIEGIAENAASHPVSRIKIVANLYNIEGALLASMESYGGNILIDSKLESLDAAGLTASLKTGKAAEDKIPPGGQIPFMMVFTTDVAGVHKLSVVAVDFVK